MLKQNALSEICIGSDLQPKKPALYSVKVC